MVKTGQTWSGLVVTKDATGALATPSVGPAGALYVDGTANGATVTITGSNPYKWTCTLPALTAGQCVSMYITATIATIATASVVAEDVADTVALSDVATAVADVPTVTEFNARTLAAADYTVVSDLGTVQTGDAYAVVAHADYGNAKLVRSTTPANTLDIAAGGEASANVTTWNGGALPAIPSVEDIWQDTYSGMSHEQAVYNAGLGGAQLTNMVQGGGDDDYQYKAYALENAPSGGLTAQETRDAMKLAPTAGDPAAGSVDKHLDDLAVDIAACGSIVANSTDDTEPGSITRRRGNSWSISLTLGDITGWTSLWFTIKSNDDDIDSAAILQVKLNATGLLDGLLYVNGAAATNDALGSITVSNAGTGAIVVAVDETITDDLTPGEYVYDAQVLIAGNVSTPDSGTFTVTSDVTRSVV